MFSITQLVDTDTDEKTELTINLPTGSTGSSNIYLPLILVAGTVLIVVLSIACLVYRLVSRYPCLSSYNGVHVLFYLLPGARNM